MQALASPRSHAGPLAVLATLAALAIVVFTTVLEGSFIQDDAAQYVSMAENLLAGHGLATSLVWTEEHHLLGGLPVAQTNLPPGYPILIALVRQFGIEPLRAALVVSIACFAIVPLLLYRIFRAVGQPPLRSLALSGVWVALPMVWFNVLAGLSETSYTLLTLVSVACVGRSEGHPEDRVTWLVLAGTFAGLAFTVRYVGVAFILSLGLLFLLRVVRRRTAESIGHLVLVTAPAMLFVLALFARNYSLTGRLAGGLRGDEGNSTSAVLQSLYWALSRISGFSKTGLLAGELAEVLLVLLALGGLAWLGLGGRVRVCWGALRPTAAEPYASLSVIYVIATLTFILVAARAHTWGVVFPRYFVPPLLPFVLLLIGYAWPLIRWESASRAQKTMAATLRWTALAMLVAGQIDVIGYRGEGESSYREIRQALQQRYGSGTLQEFLSQRITSNAPLLGNEAQLTGAVLDRPMVGLPGPFYTRTIWTEDEARRVIAKYGVAYVVFFPRLFDPSAPEDANQKFFRHLMTGKVPAWLEPSFSSPSVHLYQVNGPRA